MNKIAKFFALNRRESNLLISTFILLTLVRLGLWLISFKTLQQLLSPISKTKFPSQEKHQTSLEKIIWAVEVSSRYMPGGVKCLARALTCQVFMSRYGYGSQLCLGVTKGEAGELKAHAWVESEGKIIIGHIPDLSDFTQLASFAK